LASAAVASSEKDAAKHTVESEGDAAASEKDVQTPTPTLNSQKDEASSGAEGEET
jgi:hypothetical protein